MAVTPAPKSKKSSKQPAASKAPARRTTADAASLAATVDAFAKGKLDVRIRPADYTDPGLRLIATALAGAGAGIGKQLKEFNERVKNVSHGVDEAI